MQRDLRRRHKHEWVESHENMQRGLFQQRHVRTWNEPYKRDVYAYEKRPMKYMKMKRNLWSIRQEVYSNKDMYAHAKNPIKETRMHMNGNGNLWSIWKETYSGKETNMVNEKIPIIYMEKDPWSWFSFRRHVWMSHVTGGRHNQETNFYLQTRNQRVNQLLLDESHTTKKLTSPQPRNHLLFQSCHMWMSPVTYEFVICLIRMSHSNESRHIRMSYVTFEWVTFQRDLNMSYVSFVCHILWICHYE